MAEIDDDGNMQPTKAIGEYDRALSIYARIPNVEPRVVARALNNRGLVLSAMGHYDEAKDSLIRANTLLRNTFGDNHLLVGQSFEALAENAQNAGKFPEAQDYISRSVTVLQHVLDADNPILADTLLMQGVIYDGEKKPSDARVSLQQALDIYKKSYRGPHFKIGIAEVYLAQVESELGNIPPALRDLEDAKRNYDASYGHLHANHGDLLVYRAMVLKRANRMAEAHRDCTEGLDIIKQVGEGGSGLYKADAEICRTL
jgi:tetratricopeptide (TPR) repeat protein